MDLLKAIEQDKSVLKIVTKTKNERFFIEKWILHHLNISPGTKLIIFDNMSDDESVKKIYKKYRDNILLIKFDFYMDTVHIPDKFIQLYKAIAASSKFFTIIDSDEYLYLYDDGKIRNDDSILEFLDTNTDCNFFVPCWMENIADSETMLRFNMKNLTQFNLSKPILNTKTMPMFESAVANNIYTEIHHVMQLPVCTYGKTKTNFLLVHLKNLNKYQRIQSNMNKLVSLGFIENEKDFSPLLKMDVKTAGALSNGNIKRYILETKRIIHELHADKEHVAIDTTIKLLDEGKLQFFSESCECRFKELMNSDYFDLIGFDPNVVAADPYERLKFHV